MHHQYNFQQMYAIPTQYLCVCFNVKTNSDLCHLQHKLLGFYNRDLTLYSPVVTICTASITFNNCTVCPHCIYEFCIYLRTNSFKEGSQRFVFERFIWFRIKPSEHSTVQTMGHAEEQ